MTIDILAVSLQDQTFVKKTSVESRKINCLTGNIFSLTGRVLFNLHFGRTSYQYDRTLT